jgi:predicted ATPase/signal transduction histidine kinase
MIDLAAYVLEPLHQEGACLLSRGQLRGRRAEMVPSLLVVAPVGDHPAPASLQRLEHEYALRAELDPAWAVRPLALVQHQGRPVLVLADPGGEPLTRLLGRPLALPQGLRLAIGLAVALGQLHGRGLIHKDIKPAHVFVNDATGQVWLLGFGIASPLPRERQAPAPPEFIAGTLAYMAPEQTGRMNRSIDARSDLYALGVTLYEMLTGSLPFTASEPMEWVHCHIARRPAPPAERLPAVPSAVSAIIMKLLAKTAEDRYQTAAGLERDLRRCLAQWEAARRIDAFPLGAHDTPDRLVLPEKLYGRARQIDTLLAAFDRVVTSGMPELVLVSGAAGIGKSAVVHELHTALVPSRGFFAAGKFDQYKRDIPYATLAQALQSLLRHLLGQREAELDRWRALLREALEPNGRLMVDLVPALTLLIGAQPPVPELAPQDAQRRFQLVVRRFIGVFARPDHPLALFLDDLQWLDAGTLAVLEDLLTQRDVQHVLLIGAFRDNEVDAAHPLRRTLGAIRAAGARVREIRLVPLARRDVRQLLADALRCAPARVAPLAQLVHDKTAGNPFFAMQFMAALADEGVLTFEHGQGCWSWDLDRMHAKGYTDNVVDLMVGKLHRLPVDTQEALQQLACLGHSAASTTLALVHETSEEAVHAQLWEAVRREVIERREGAYTFIHDRVQEAAYALIPEEGRAAAHLRIGRLLVAHTPPEERDEAIFELVNQLNRGAALITAHKEREQLAELNLMAGTRAKQATAYASALTYLLAGAALVAEDGWKRQHALAFALEFHRAACEFLTGALAAAEERLTALVTRAATTVEHATVACLRMDVYTTLGQGGRAIAVGLAYLRRVGIDWSQHPTDEDVRREYERIWTQLGGRTVEELIELPLMSNDALLATLDVLTQLGSPAWHTDANLLSLVVCRAVNLSLEGGNCDSSCYAYVLLGVIAGPRFGDYQAGFRFGQLGYDLVEQRGLKRFQAEVYLTLNLVLPWTRHVRICRDLLRRAFEAANMIGDLTCASYCSNQLNANLLAVGDPLAETQRVAENGLAFAQKMRFGHSIDVVSTQLGLIRTLRGLTRTFGSLDDERFDERRIERRFADNPDLVVAESRYWIRKLQARYLAGDFAAAAEAASQAERLLWISQTPLDAAECHLYCALSHAAVCDSATADERQQHVEALTAHHRQLAVWAENGPENFENRAALVGAEIARLEGRELDAERLYEEAIRSARENGFVHHEALANELAARFYAARGFETIAHAYLRNARYGYLRWGADGKVRQLDQLYPHLRTEEAAAAPTGTIGAPVEHLDLATVIKVSQAVSGEIVLEKLLDTLMRTALEQAGAERGLLLLPRGDELRLAAEATTSGDTVIVRLTEQSMAAAALPASIVQYVIRTQDSVLLDDAAAPNAFAADASLGAQHARSILCVPLLNQAKLTGVLYLENTLTPHVFTPTRSAVLTLLASQAAISLENARLYAERQRAEEAVRQTQAELAHVARLTTLGELTASIAHEINQPLGAMVNSAHACVRWLAAQNLERARQSAVRIVADGQRAADTITRIRALAGNAPSHQDWLDLNATIRDVLALARSEVHRHGVVVETQLAADVPRIRGDRIQLQQVLLNLIMNAIEAMNGVGDGPRVLVVRSDPDAAPGVLVAVCDSGPGLDPQRLDRLFEAFYTTKPQGLGLGLAISRRIIEAHGGRLWATANVPRGAVMQFTVPRGNEEGG